MAEEECRDIQELVDDAMADAQATLNEVVDQVNERDATQSALSVAADERQASVALEGGQSDWIQLLGDVDLNVAIELGRTEMAVEDVLKLGVGSVVELDKLAGDPVEVYANDRLVARGEVLVVDDNFCIRITEIVDDLEEQAKAVLGEQRATSE